MKPSTSFLSTFSICFSAVRQVIPIIRGNDTLSSGGGTVTLAGRKRRSVTDADAEARFHGDKIDYDKWRRPEFARSTDRAAVKLREPLQSRVLRKKQRFLRMVGLQKLEEAQIIEGRAKRSLVPR